MAKDFLPNTEERDRKRLSGKWSAVTSISFIRWLSGLEKLQGLLNKQGIALSASAIATGLATEAITAAPAGLASAIAGTALASAAASGIALTAFELMSMETLGSYLVICHLKLACAEGRQRNDQC